MANKSEITNNGPIEYIEEFKGKVYKIAPGEKILMSRSDAVSFMGRRPPGGVQVDGMNQLLPKSIKALSIRHLKEQEAKIWVSNRNGERYQNEKDMLEGDAPYENLEDDDKTEVSANEHACHFCDFTTNDAVNLLSHIGKEHTGETSRHTQPSSLSV